MKKLSNFKFSVLCAIAGISMSSSAFAQALNGQYTINAALPASSSNFQSFTSAVAALNTNGVSGLVNIEVWGSSYNEQVTLNAITGVSATNTVTFHGNGSAAISFNPASTNNRAIIKLNGADYVTISNLSITATGSSTAEYGYGIQLMNGADYNQVRNCSISVNRTDALISNFAGIVLNSVHDAIETQGNANCHYNTIENNTVNGGTHGIAFVANGNANMISGNKIINNNIEDFFRAGIYLDGNDGTLVEGNRISRPNRNNAALFYGIQLINPSRNLQVLKNRIYNPFGGANATVNSGSNGIYCTNLNTTADNQNMIANNAIYNFNFSGSIIRGVWIDNTSYTKFINNTVALDEESYSGFAGTYGFTVTANSSNLTLQNNLVSIKRGGSFATKYGIEMGSVNNNVISNNNLFLTSIGMVYTGKWGNTNCATIANWASNSGDLTSIAQDPQFTNAAVGNLLPLNTGLQSGAAVANTGIATDISGLGRNASTPTIGAFEIGGVVLPVQMSALSVKLSAGNQAQLSWTTYKEENNLGFEVQVSHDGKSWSAAGFVASRAVSGNSTETLQYAFIEGAVLDNKRYYRLQQIDADGKTTFSNVVVLNPGATNSHFFASIYPNPVTDFLQVNFQDDTQAKADVIIADVAGKIVSSAALNPGNKTINTAGLSKGMYLLHIISGAHQETLKFVKQ